uniref:Sulfotransferase n=1 Tax=Laticauda laticaudata TaxID=8630 RepID=A0A8C5WTE6_LATLA
MARLDVTEVFANIRLPGHLHTQSSLHSASNFEFQDTDVLLVTYPKSGTTWMQEILTLIHSDGNLEPIKTLPNWARAPWLEHSYFQEQLQHMKCPRLLTTHLPQPVLAPALKKAKPKVIYVVRNPKDVVVSYYHFQRMAKFFPEPSSFEGFLHDFMAGTVHYGSWFEHVKGWLSCREELGLFCVTYEELHHVLLATGGTTSPPSRALYSTRDTSRKWGATPGPSSGTWTDSSCPKTSIGPCKVRPVSGRQLPLRTFSHWGSHQSGAARENSYPARKSRLIASRMSTRQVETSHSLNRGDQRVSFQAGWKEGHLHKGL